MRASRLHFSTFLSVVTSSLRVFRDIQQFKALNDAINHFQMHTHIEKHTHILLIPKPKLLVKDLKFLCVIKQVLKVMRKVSHIWRCKFHLNDTWVVYVSRVCVTIISDKRIKASSCVRKLQTEYKTSEWMFKRPAGCAETDFHLIPEPEKDLLSSQHLTYRLRFESFTLCRNKSKV